VARTPLWRAVVGAALGCAVAASSAAEPAGADGGAHVVRNAGPGYDRFYNADGSFTDSDNTGKGAVLCFMAITEELRAIGNECLKGERPAVQAELTRALERIDHFISANSANHPTLAQLDAARAARLRHLSPDACKGAGVAMYRKIGDDPANVRKSVDDLLSIPREPVMNPCL
jgi:hypothetical protein